MDHKKGKTQITIIVHVHVMYSTKLKLMFIVIIWSPNRTLIQSEFLSLHKYIFAVNNNC